MTILLPYFEIKGLSSYPDDPTLFDNTREVDIEGTQYYVTDYKGSLDLETGEHTYSSHGHLVPALETGEIPAITLSKFTVRANNVAVLPQEGIYWVGTDDKLEVTADVVDHNDILTSIMSTEGKDALNMVIITQEVFGGDYSDVKDSTRFGISMDSSSMTLVSNKGFGTSGNYIVTKERLNLGLSNLNLPFRIEMEMVEFDVLNK